MDNLNYYSAWLPAGQQTDRYSSQPWCLRSKNLDIFSSSKSVKATAWSQPTQWDADVIKQDWKLLLKTDGKVYERTTNWDVLVVDPSVNFPSYLISYTWRYWPREYAQWGTVQDMVAKYEWDEWKSFVVYTDRSSFVYSKTMFTWEKSFIDRTWFNQPSATTYTDGYKFTKANTSDSNCRVRIYVNKAPLSKMLLKIKAEESTTPCTISLNSINVDERSNYYYDAQTDSIICRGLIQLQPTWTGTITDWIMIELPTSDYGDDFYIQLSFNFSKNWGSNYDRSDWKLYIDMNWWEEETNRVIVNWARVEWDSNYYYTYLPIRDRKLVSIWDYAYSQSYWMKGTSFQPLYKWTWSWIQIDGQNKIIYDFVTDMWWETDVSMDIVGMMVWNEQVYMIGNMDWNWYIIPCDLSWWRWTPYIAYGCQFLWVTNIDYLMYLVGTDRGISQLWVYNGQELVSIIWWDRTNPTNDIVDGDEQYKFDWKMVEYRWDLVLTTSDNRIFQYWQTYWGKGWTFIHEIPWTITELKVAWEDLTVKYSVTSGWATTTYITTYQDDTDVKYYNSEWEAVYPIVLWNHLLEKEESDLYVSYIIPSNLTKLEFWWCANHYHFWTFKMEAWTQAPAVWSTWEIDWVANIKPLFQQQLDNVEFIEANWDYFTFRIVWELPVLSGNETWRLKQKSIKDGTVYMNYTEVHHFRKIWEITANWFEEWKFRFTNLNNKLELPKAHSLQIMVKGTGTSQFTPELFSLDLVANQRERW